MWSIHGAGYVFFTKEKPYTKQVNYYVWLNRYTGEKAAPSLDVLHEFPEPLDPGLQVDDRVGDRHVERLREFECFVS